MIVVTAVMLDAMFLFVGMLQVAQGAEGYWAPFWRNQAVFVLNLTK